MSAQTDREALIAEINAVLHLQTPPPWSAQELEAALRYARKNDVGPLQRDDPGELPHDYDATKIVQMPALLRRAAAALSEPVAQRVDREAEPELDAKRLQAGEGP
jgi:hypothetical protein